MSEVKPVQETVQPSDERELVISRVVDLPAEKLYRCWTEAALLTRWFTPAPWTTPEARLDVRPGGSNYVLMRGPDGTEAPNRGVYLEVVPNRRIVFTDAFTSAWVPSAKPFFVGEITFEDLGGGRTRYTARARHWTLEDCQAHEQRGFHAGWNAAADQMQALAATL